MVCGAHDLREANQKEALAREAGEKASFWGDSSYSVRRRGESLVVI